MKKEILRNSIYYCKALLGSLFLFTSIAVATPATFTIEYQETNRSTFHSTNQAFQLELHTMEPKVQYQPYAQYITLFTLSVLSGGKYVPQTLGGFADQSLSWLSYYEKYCPEGSVPGSASLLTGDNGEYYTMWSCVEDYLGIYYNYYHYLADDLLPSQAKTIVKIRQTS